ncbi:MAG: hypothetical protein KDK36_05680 [Leptospiraceae bacterium]|nr:hypothetical protein [Leptospiraceae bacterium]
MWNNFKEAFNFTLNNSQRVFTAIIVIMLIIFTFVRAFIKMIFDFVNYSKITDERIDLDLFGIKLKLLSTQYDLVVMILIAMVLMYFHRIINHWITVRFGGEIQEERTIEKEYSNDSDPIQKPISTIEEPPPKEIGSTNADLFGGR